METFSGRVAGEKKSVGGQGSESQRRPSQLLNCGRIISCSLSKPDSVMCQPENGSIWDLFFIFNESLKIKIDNDALGCRKWTLKG